MTIDIWGRIYDDEWCGQSHPHVFHRDDGSQHTVASAASYFVAPRGDADREVLDRLTGRVLDLGCGAGSYALYLAGRGCNTVAIDSSPGAIAVCSERGCGDARVLGIDDVGVDLGSFHAIICMGNTFGIDSHPATMPTRLARLASVLAPNGVLVAAMIDPLSTDDPTHLAYHERNRRLGRPPGLASVRIEYRGETSDWWDLWMPTASEFRAAARTAGWRILREDREGVSILYELTPDYR